MFKSAEERAAEKKQHEAAEAQLAAIRAEQASAAAEDRQRQAFLASPVGAATAAKEAGQEFFEVQLQVGTHTGTASWGAAESRRTHSSSAETLGQIETLGWHLEHAGYYFMITGEQSTARVFVSGEAIAVSGVTMGVYLFRSTARAEPQEPADPPGTAEPAL